MTVPWKVYHPQGSHRNLFTYFLTYLFVCLPQRSVAPTGPGCTLSLRPTCRHSIGCSSVPRHVFRSFLRRQIRSLDPVSRHAGTLPPWRTAPSTPMAEGTTAPTVSGEWSGRGGARKVPRTGGGGGTPIKLFYPNHLHLRDPETTPRKKGKTG